MQRNGALKWLAPLTLGVVGACGAAPQAPPAEVRAPAVSNPAAPPSAIAGDAGPPSDAGATSTDPRTLASDAGVLISDDADASATLRPSGITAAKRKTQMGACAVDADCLLTFRAARCCWPCPLARAISVEMRATEVKKCASQVCGESPMCRAPPHPLSAYRAVCAEGACELLSPESPF